MATFRTQHHVPDVYVKGSRDFQLFCNLLDCINGGVKFDIDSILDVLDTNQCNEKLIPYLQTKLGFWTKEKISAEKLRIILKGFPYAVKHKGSIIGIQQAVQIFLKAVNIKTSVHIEIVNEVTNVTQQEYTVVIGTDTYLGDTTILDEILKYIIPAGYGVRYVFYADKTFENGLNYTDSVKIVTGQSSLLNAVRTTYIEENGNVINYPIDTINNVTQTAVASNRSLTRAVNNYEDAPLVRNPQVIDGDNTPIAEKSTINELYNESVVEDEFDTN